MVKCPGQDQRFWKPGDIFEVNCGNCGRIVEFWKDEPRRKCSSCGEKVNNPRIDLGCAEWCQYAEQCLAAVGSSQDDIVCQKLISQMRNVFGDDEKRINHALRVLSFAEQLLQNETADPLVVKAAAVLHDIGIKKAQEVHGSAAGKYQEIEGPPIAEEIMKTLRLDTSVIEHVCRIIANHHSAKDIDTPEFRILWDADWLVNIPEELGGLAESELKQKIDKIFKTQAGKELAVRLYT
jgi:HD superfamily phosphodiesterase